MCWSHTVGQDSRLVKNNRESAEGSCSIKGAALRWDGWNASKQRALTVLARVTVGRGAAESKDGSFVDYDLSAPVPGHGFLL